jgi:hypothetical protein
MVYRISRFGAELGYLGRRNLYLEGYSGMSGM